MEKGIEWRAESKFREEERIVKKIRARKVLHCSSWDWLDFIVRELGDQGYQICTDKVDIPFEPGQGKMLFRKNEDRWAVLIFQHTFKQTILVAFFDR